MAIPTFPEVEFVILWTDVWEEIHDVHRLEDDPLHITQIERVVKMARKPCRRVSLVASQSRAQQ